MDEQLAVLLAELVPQLGRSLKAKFPTLEAEDIESQCWVGILEHQDELARLVQAEDVTKASNDARQYATKAVASLRREQDRHRRAIKALKGGYGPADEAFYSLGMLRGLIPAYLDSGITAEPPKGREVVPPSGDPAESGKWLAQMIDIDYAFWKLRTHHRKVLARYFSYPQGAGGWTHVEISNAMGIPPEVLKGRVSRALRAMQLRLGGSDPRQAKHESQARHG